MRSFRHWTPRYIVDRVGVSFFQYRNPDAPWLTPDAIAILDSWLRPTDRGVEWGSGRSTRWFGNRVASLLSIEHDAEWYARVTRTLPPSVDYRMLDGQGYVDAGRELADSSLDFALVDGQTHFRDACALLAIAKLRPGGMLIIDNANWFIPHETRSPASVKSPPTDAWEEIGRTLLDWRCIWTSNGVTDTGLWFKPNTVP